MPPTMHPNGVMRFAGMLLIGSIACLSASAEPIGDPARGDTLSQTCVACHGTDGNSLSGAFPSLAGQGQRYLFDQMKAMREGTRTIPVMAGQLDAMSDQDLRDIAAWYSGNEAQIGQATEASLEKGQALYRHGDVSRQIPACAACHGPNGRGIVSAGIPALSGQHSEYIATSLKAYRTDQRVNLLANEAMSTISRRLTEEEIQALAEFIQGLY